MAAPASVFTSPPPLTPVCGAEATDMMVVDVTKTRWERITDSLKQTPLIRSMLDVSEQVRGAALQDPGRGTRCDALRRGFCCG